MYSAVELKVHEIDHELDQKTDHELALVAKSQPRFDDCCVLAPVRLR